MSAAGLAPDAPLSIAYLTYRGKPHVGGQGVYTRHLTKALADLGHTVEVFGGQPYPQLDPRVPLTKLPSLDTFNDHYPGRLPGFWEIKTREDALEGRHPDPSVQEPHEGPEPEAVDGGQLGNTLQLHQPELQHVLDTFPGSDEARVARDQLQQRGLARN